jgi:uncharacterized protein YndB with AHSA1/START domain
VVEHAVELEIALPAPPKTVFRAWTTAQDIIAWWGEPGVYRTTDWSADVRAGGAWRADFAGDGGEPFSAEGRNLTVDASRRLVWTWTASWSPEETNTIDMTFEAAVGGTVLRLRNFGFADASELADVEDGWRQTTGWLRDYLATAR